MLANKGAFMKRIILLLAALLISAPAWALVPNATPLFNQYNCNSSTTQFPYAFPITATSDMTVYITDSNGNITTQSGTFSVDQTNLWVNYPLMGSPCPTGSTITLIPSTPQTQTTVYANRTPFTATAVGVSFDKLTLISQQLQGQINRAFLQPVNFTGTATFPESIPGYLIGWNGSGVLANITNPSLTAQWTLSGANISYNTGNVSTTNNFTTGSLNWTNIQLLKSSEINWSNINGLKPINYGGINWASTNIFPTSSSGNVGIGSSNPGQILDVQGTIRSTYFSGNGIIPIGGIVIWSGSIISIPSGWHLCDGTNGTPNLENLFIIGAGGIYSVGGTGGSTTITTSNLPASPLTVSGSTSNGSSNTTIQFTTNGGSVTTMNTSNLGSAAAYLPPYYALAYIQRIS